MHNSEQFEVVEVDRLIHEEARHGSDHIEDEVAQKVVVGNLLQLSVSSGSLNKVKDDINEEDDVKNQVDLVQSRVILIAC